MLQYAIVPKNFVFLTKFLSKVFNFFYRKDAKKAQGSQRLNKIFKNINKTLRALRILCLPAHWRGVVAVK
jgi:hypothetical protein